MAGRGVGRYPPEYKEQMVELVRAGRSPGSLAREFEPTEQTIRNWVKQADLDEGRRSDGLTTEARVELLRLKRENKRLRMERDIPKRAAAWFARESGSISLKSLARRVLALNEEIAKLDRFIAPLVKELAPDLLKLEGVGFASAGELLVTAGENPDRLRSEASFAMLCGACPLPASSGKTQRHRLNRGGNRQANSALHMIVVCRMRTDQRTRTYVERRTGEGLSKREVMRCLKRYVAREIYRVLTAPSPT